jgi:hypothetical protein
VDAAKRFNRRPLSQYHWKAKTGGEMDMEEKLIKRIKEELQNNRIKYTFKPSIGGLQPDFLIIGPNNEKLLIEAKSWDPIGGNTSRAIRQVKNYKQATGVDKVYIVFSKLRRSYESKGVIGVESLIPSINAYLRKQVPEKQRNVSEGTKQPTSKMVFAAMPFDKEYDDTFLIAMSYAAKSINAICKRVDKTEFTGDVVEEIKRLIRMSIAVIVDLSENKPNVLYEAGYAHALNKPTVHISSTSLDTLPFDVRNWNTLKYYRGQTASLQEPLAGRLKRVIK